VRQRVLKRRQAAIFLFAVVFSLAAIFLLYEGATTGDYLLVALVIVAYVFFLTLEASLAVRGSRPKPLSRKGSFLHLGANREGEWLSTKAGPASH
jgi:drug/metabolite transporter (DMT)-like permease